MALACLARPSASSAFRLPRGRRGKLPAAPPGANRRWQPGCGSACACLHQSSEVAFVHSTNQSASLRVSSGLRLECPGLEIDYLVPKSR